MATTKSTNYSSLVTLGYKDGAHWDTCNMEIGTAASGKNNEIIYCNPSEPLFDGARTGDCWSTTSALMSRDISQSVSYLEIKVAHCTLIAIGKPLITIGVISFDATQENFKDRIRSSWEMNNEGDKLLDGVERRFTERIANFKTYGIFYDANLTTLEFFIDGVTIGKAFDKVFSQFPLRPILKVSRGKAIAVVCRSRRMDLSLSGACMRLIREKPATFPEGMIQHLPSQLYRQAKMFHCGCSEIDHGQNSSQNWFEHFPSLLARRLLKRAVLRGYSFCSNPI